MRTAYAVTSGSYSDYQVLAVFASEADAEATAAAMRADEDGWRGDVTVEAMKFFAEGERPQKVAVYTWTVEVTNEGTTRQEITRFATEWEHDHLFHVPANGRPLVRYVRAPIYKGQAGRLEVRGTDLDAVKKAYSDTLVRLLSDESYRMQTHEAES